MTIGFGGGDRDARFEAMYRKHFARVFRSLRAFGVADGEAQDLAQETFKRIFESFDQYRGEAEWSFIEITARRVLYNWVRSGNTAKRKADLVEIDDPDFQYEPVAAAEPDYADRQEEAMRKARLREAVAELSPIQRECLRLWVQGFKYTEIATILKTSVDAVKSRLRDAKKFLRERLGSSTGGKP
jgi:RNA polymerase sigma-70 factor (ECF subfamily)